MPRESVTVKPPQEGKSDTLRTACSSCRHRVAVCRSSLLRLFARACRRSFYLQIPSLQWGGGFDMAAVPHLSPDLVHAVSPYGSAAAVIPPAAAAQS